MLEQYRLLKQNKDMSMVTFELIWLKQLVKEPKLDGAKMTVICDSNNWVYVLNFTKSTCKAMIAPIYTL